MQAFHSSSIEAFQHRVGPDIYHNVRQPDKNTQHIFVAVDPSGGGASAFSVATLTQSADGHLHVRLLPVLPHDLLPRPRV